MAILKDILRIKVLREDRAEKAFVARRQEHALARAALLRQEEDLRCFREYRVTHERELYQELCQRIVRLRDIEAVQYQAAEMRQGERDREELERQAIVALEQANQARQGAEHVWREANRTREGFMRVVDDFDHGLRLILERAEELELEESFRVVEDREDMDAWSEEHAEAG